MNTNPISQPRDHVLPDERAEEPLIANALLCCQAGQQQDGTTLSLQASNRNNLKASKCKRSMVKMKAPGQCNMFFVAKER
jgi:hypothetical protein